MWSGRAIRLSALEFGVEHSAETLEAAVHIRTWRAVPRSGDTRPPLEHPSKAFLRYRQASRPGYTTGNWRMVSGLPDLGPDAHTARSGAAARISPARNPFLTSSPRQGALHQKSFEE